MADIECGCTPRGEIPYHDSAAGNVRCLLCKDPAWGQDRDSFFPESVWAKGSSNSGGLSNIFTPSHLHITSSNPHILKSSHPHIFTSSHLHIVSSSHLLIFTSSHLHITSSHLHIFSSSHLLIFSSSHPHVLTSSHPHIVTSSHLHILSCPLALLPFLNAQRSANETARNATLSHETRLDRQKLRWNCNFTTSATFSREIRFDRQNWGKTAMLSQSLFS